MAAIRFPISRWKVFLHLLFSFAVFAGAMIWLRFGGSPLLWVSLYFLLGASFHLQRLLSDAPVIEITETGIIDGTPMLGVGEIPWEDIELVYLGRKYSALFVTVSSPGPYLARLDLLKRLNARLSTFYGATPLVLGLSTAEARPEDIWITVQNHYEFRGEKIPTTTEPEDPDKAKDSGEGFGEDSGDDSGGDFD